MTPSSSSMFHKRGSNGFVDELNRFIRHKYDQPETEEVRISVSKQDLEGEIGENVILRDASIERLQTVA
jgi:hypothetical protein